MNDLLEELDIIPPLDKSTTARLEYIDHHEFRNVRVACIDTSTARLFVEFCLGVSRIKGGGDGLSVSEYAIVMRLLQAKDRLTLVLPSPYSLKPAART